MGLAGTCNPVRICSAQVTCVVISPEMDVSIKRLDDQFIDGRHIIKLLIRCKFVKGFLCARNLICKERMRAGFDDLLIHGESEFICNWAGAYKHLLSLFYFNG